MGRGPGVRPYLGSQPELQGRLHSDRGFSSTLSPEEQFPGLLIRISPTLSLPGSTPYRLPSSSSPVKRFSYYSNCGWSPDGEKYSHFLPGPPHFLNLSQAAYPRSAVLFSHQPNCILLSRIMVSKRCRPSY